MALLIAIAEIDAELAEHKKTSAAKRAAEAANLAIFSAAPLPLSADELPRGYSVPPLKPEQHGYACVDRASPLSRTTPSSLAGVLPAFTIQPSPI